MSQLLTTLTDTDRMVSLQFSFTNASVIPWNLKELQVESQTASKERKEKNRKGNVAGNNLLPDSKPKETNISDLPASLGHSGYILVATQYQERVDQRKKNQTYHMVRFIFARQEHVDTGNPGVQELEPRRGVALARLDFFAQLAYWQVRAYRNPFYKDGELEKGQHAVSLNFDGRTPLFDGSQLPATPQDVPQPKHRLALDAQNNLSISTV